MGRGRPAALALYLEVEERRERRPGTEQKTSVGAAARRPDWSPARSPHTSQ